MALNGCDLKAGRPQPASRSLTASLLTAGPRRSCHVTRRLTDSKGRTVSFSNTVIIMTSNLGAHALLEQVH